MLQSTEFGQSSLGEFPLLARRLLPKLDLTGTTFMHFPIRKRPTMARIRNLRAATGIALASLVGAALILPGASAQEKEATPKTTWLTAGFVRPGMSADAKVTGAGSGEGLLG